MELCVSSSLAKSTKHMGMPNVARMISPLSSSIETNKQIMKHFFCGLGEHLGMEN